MLGGAMVVPVSGKESFNRELAKIIEEDDIGIAAIPEEAEDWIDETNQKAMKLKSRPLLARYHYPKKWALSPTADRYAEDVASRALGFHFRIKL